MSRNDSKPDRMPFWTPIIASSTTIKDVILSKIERFSLFNKPPAIQVDDIKKTIKTNTLMRFDNKNSEPIISPTFF
ncbi:hypothetical protein D3C80_1250880 [compost metagenome]